MQELFWFVVFVVCCQIYVILKELYKWADFDFYFKNDGCVANWIVDVFFVFSFFALKLLLNSHGSFSPTKCVQLVLLGYLFSGIYSIISSVFLQGRIPVSRFWAYASKGSTLRLAIFIGLYFSAFIYFYR